MKLLIVDDSVIIRKSIETFSATLKFEIVGQAGDGRTAVELFKQFQPDYVTMDITMPEMDGLTAMREMLKFKADAKIMIVSAITNQSTIIEALSSGAKHYLNKPFNEASMKAALTKLIG